MSSPKIFISHSTRTAEHLKLLKQICDELKSSGFNVLVDRELSVRDRWYACIHEWMYECYAIVILLSDAALESD